jgi:nanoRNase/pAp phosphatase (c-di-AMP/oligoRNAs hydrolase)
LAASLGGGGHKAAAGISLEGMSLADAKKLVVAKAKELYNL